MSATEATGGSPGGEVVVPGRLPHPDDLLVLADLADVAFFEVDEDHNLVAFSPAAERITGFRAEEVLGRHCLAAIRCPLCLQGCRVFEAGEIRNVPLTLFRKDGSEVRILKSGKAIRGRGGKVIGAVEVLRPADEVAAGLVRSGTGEGELSPCEAEEVRRIEGALAATRYRRAEAARLLGMSRTTLWRKMKRYGLA